MWLDSRVSSKINFTLILPRPRAQAHTNCYCYRLHNTNSGEIVIIRIIATEIGFLFRSICFRRENIQFFCWWSAAAGVWHMGAIHSVHFSLKSSFNSPKNNDTFVQFVHTVCNHPSNFTIVFCVACTFQTDKRSLFIVNWYYWLFICDVESCVVLSIFITLAMPAIATHNILTCHRRSLLLCCANYYCYQL